MEIQYSNSETIFNRITTTGLKVITITITALLISFGSFAESNGFAGEFENASGPFMDASAYDQFDYESAYAASMLQIADCPLNITVNCGESIDPSITGAPIGLDGPAVVTYTDEGDGQCPETITRTFSIVYNDPALGSETCSQDILVENDGVGPTLNISNSSISVQCPGDIPDAPVATATDDCDSDVEITFIDTDYSLGVENCILTDAVGTSPNVWALYLPNLPEGLTQNWIFDADGGMFTTFADGTAHVTGRVHAANDPSLIFRIDITVKEKKNWAEWSTSPTNPPVMAFRSYKDSDGIAAALGNVWDTWDYYVIDDENSYLIGEGGMTGSILSLEHAPASYYFGWQVGLAANDTNGNQGMASWFSYTGNVVINGNTYPNASGIGDINADSGCSPNNENPCIADIERTWIAVDNCGNATVVTQMIHIEDTTPPVLSPTPGNITVECDAIPAPPTVTATDNCDGAVPVDFEETSVPDPNCGEVITRTWTAIDECGNPVTHTQTITVTDTVDPTFDSVPGDMTIECGDPVPAIPTLTASDICDDDVAVTSNEVEDSTIDCPAVTTYTRTWTATDDCGNTATATQVITVVDNTPPTISCPPNATVDCPGNTDPANTGSATGTDECSAVTITSVDGPQSGECPITFTRTWTATDACGNASSCTQTISLDDNTPPTFTNVPDDITIDCSDAVPASNATATDECSSVSVTQNDVSTGVCPVIITRTFTATDACGNSATETQTITVDDNTPPTITGPANITVECEGDVPGAGSVTTDDNCDNDLTISFSETDNSSAEEICQLESIINGSSSWSFLLMNLPGGLTNQWHFDASGGTFTSFGDGTALLTGNIVSSVNPNYKFAVSMKAIMKRSWDQWSALPTIPASGTNRTYKDDSGFALAGGNLWEDWDFYEIDEDNSTLIGLDGLAGSSLSLRQAPNNFLYGWQVGQAANDFSADLGMSTWMYFDGNVTIDGVPYNDVEGNGDVNTINTCTPVPNDECEYDITRTWTATDDCGNMSTFTQTIHVEDTTPPVLSECPADDQVNCHEIPDAPVITALDNCDGIVPVLFNETTAPGACPQESVITRTWTAIDDCENEVFCEQILTVVDNAPPVLSALPDDMIIECDQPVPAPPVVTATDLCDPDVEAVMTGGTAAGDCPGEMVITRVFTATDDCGNFTNNSYTITIVDTQAPTVTPDADITIDCLDAIPAADYTTSDNCSTVTVAVSEVTAGDACLTTITRTYVPTDACGNVGAAATQVVTIIDNTAPTVTPDADITIDCLDAIPAADYTTSDDCNAVTVAVSEVTAGDACLTTITRTYVPTDACGNVGAAATQVVTITDTTAPTVTPDADITIDCQDAIPAADYTTSDDCNAVTVAVSEVTTGDACLTTITRTYVPTDACGNVGAAATQVVTITDTTAPTVTPDADITIDCLDAIPAADYTTSDDCNAVTVAVSEVTAGDACLTTITRTYVPTDACGNVGAAATQVVTIIDNTAPTVTPDADITIDCLDAIPAADYTTSDDCNAVTVAVSEVTAGDACLTTITRTYVPTDACGNVGAAATQVVTITDTTAPTVTPDADITIDCLDAIPAADYTTSDDCNAVTVAVSEVTTGDACLTTITRTYVPTDACGNVGAAATQVVTITDTTAPTVTPDADITIDCQDAIPAADYTTSDDCNAVTVAVSEVTAGDACLTTITRTYVPTDACGNVGAAATQVVTITDTTAPTVTPDADITIDCQDAIPAADYTTSDDCNAVTVAVSEVTAGDACLTTITRTYVPTDACGNVGAAATQVVTITDTTAPTVTPAADVSIDCLDPIPAADYTTSDDCNAVTVAVSEVTTGDACLTTITRTYVPTDACGNVGAAATQVVTITDTTAPTFTSVPSNVTIECTDALPTDMATATDDCNSVNVTSNDVTTGSCPTIVTRTFTATDACGLSTTAVQVITIDDTVAPVLSSLPGNVTAECDNVPAIPTVTASDACDDDPTFTVVTTNVPGSCADAYQLVTVWTATDNCGNTTSHTQTITVQDTTDPVFVDPPAVEIDVECENVPDPNDLMATDNCDDDVTIVFSELEFSGGCTSTFERTWVATDNCGNSTTFVQLVHLIDTTPPVLVGVPADITVNCQDGAPAVPAVTATDNCDDDVVPTFTETSVPGDCPQESVITRSWTATDDCLNTVTESYTITIVDNAPPVLSALPDDMIIECDQPVPAPPMVTATDLCDPDVEAVMTGGTAPGDCPGEMVITRVFTATDDCGNFTNNSYTITIVDTQAPTVTPAADVTIDCLDAIPAADYTTSDNCNAVTVAVSEVTAGDACLTTITRTYVPTDACGNVGAAATQVVTITDTTAPTVTPDADITIDCLDAIPAADYTTSDDCNAVTVAVSEVTAGDACLTTITRTYVPTDACGNVGAAATQVVTITDTTAPTVTPDADITIDCQDAIPAADYTTSDDCNAVTVAVSEVTTGDACLTTITRTYVPTDACGNVGAAATQVVTITDTTAPTVTPDADITIDCLDAIPAADYTTSDDCNAVTVAVSEVTAGDACLTTITRTYVPTDACGNVGAAATQVVTIIDNTAPTVTPAADITIDCLDAIPAADYMTNDDCNAVTVAVSEVTTGDACLTTITRTYVPTDACGNVGAAATQIVTITDTTAPTVTPDADITIDCLDAIPAADYTTSDDCNAVTVAVSEVTAGDACLTTITRTYVPTDACGNVGAAATQVVTITDTTAPTVTPDADITIDCQDAIPAADYTTSDDCNAVTVAVSEVTAGDACLTTITRTYVPTDACGNVGAAATQVVTITDTTAPTVTPDADITIDCLDPIPAADYTTSDDCNAVTVAVSEVTAGDACLTTITRTYVPTDACGNVGAAATQVVTIIDNTAPTVTPAADITIDCLDAIPAADYMTNDDCNAVTVAVSEVTTGDACLTTITRTYVPTDACGNVGAAATQVVTITDTTAPTVTPDADITIDCLDAIPAADYTTSDDCNAVTVAVSEVTAGDACLTTITRTYVPTDACGNVGAAATQVVTITDTTAPTVTPDADITIDCQDAIPAADYTTSDDCNAVTVAVSEVTAGDACLTTITRTYVPTDACGNVGAAATQVVTITDTTAPTVTPDADITIDCLDPIPAADYTTSDDCNAVTVAVSEVTAGDACLTTITRTYVPTDACGNVGAAATQVVTITDTTAPTVTPAADVSIDCLDPIPAADYTTSDDCNAVTVAVSEVTTGDACLTTITRTYVPTDACGNVGAAATQVVTITDTTAPTFTSVPSNVTIECTDALPTDMATATDDCNSVNVTSNDVTTGSCPTIVTRTFTATDACGLSTTAVQVITIDDTVAPVLSSLPGNVTAECDNVPAIPTVTASDACDDDPTFTVVTTNVPGSCADAYQLVTVWTATDNCGNTTSHTQTITVQDTTDPVFVDPPAVEIDVECENVPDPNDLMATDNCDDDVTIVFSELEFSGGCTSTFERTWVATDNCGNSTTFVQLVHLIDTTPPVLVGVPADATYECDETIPDATVTATDNCDDDVVPTFTETSVPGDCPQESVITRTWTAIDDCLNEAKCITNNHNHGYYSTSCNCSY